MSSATYEPDLKTCTIMAALAAIPLLVFYYLNKDTKKVERFLYNDDHQKYMLMHISVFVLMTACIFNARIVVNKMFTKFISRWKLGLE